MLGMITKSTLFPAGLRRGGPTRRGFTLAEALISMAIAMLAASSMLMASYTAMFQMTDGTDRMLAAGIARQIINEIEGLPYREKGMPPNQISPGTEADDIPVYINGRMHFDDIDDYNGYSCSPIRDRWGVPLGQGNDAGGNRDMAFRTSSVNFSNWRVTVSVNYVPEGNWISNLGPNSVSDFRAVEVVVSKSEQGSSRELARLRRVMAYVPAN